MVTPVAGEKIISVKDERGGFCGEPRGRNRVRIRGGKC